MMKKIAMMGGSFDPVHEGHISYARDVLKKTPVDEVVFMPAKLQPFKLDLELSSFEDRIEMIRLAIRKEAFMFTSELENELEGISYTYRTLEEFKKKSKEEIKVYFMVGTDAFIQMDTWMKADQLLSDNAIIVAHRPGYNEEKLYQKKTEYEKIFNAEIITVENVKVDVSSTEIREKIQRGTSLGGIIPEEVEAYIRKKGLYK